MMNTNMFINEEQDMLYPENYWIYTELINSKKITVHTKDINKQNWELHFNSVTNLFKDAIETDICKLSIVEIVFDNNISIELSLFDYWINLALWFLFIYINTPIIPKYIYFEKYITRSNIKKYIDELFIEPNINKIDKRLLNNIIDDCLHSIVLIDKFSMYLSNSVNLEDFVFMMIEDEEFSDLINTSFDGVSLDELSHYSKEKLNRLTEKIINSDHCLSNSLKAQEGLNIKQFKEVAIGIGTKPDGNGNIYPTIIGNSYLNGGANDAISHYIEASVSRQAQIIVDTNTADAGYFSRLVGINNIDTALHEDPNFTCTTKNFQEIYISNANMLKLFIDRYYRLNPNGVDFKIKNLEESSHLIGKTIYLRSPITCESYSRIGKVCYKCYGDLAYINKDINIGKIASELLCSILTQKMLSAKHLMEASMKEIKWVEEFYNYFGIEYNLINMSVNIDPKINLQLSVYETELDSRSDEDGSITKSDSEFPYYTSEVVIILPNKEEIKIYNSTYDLFLTYEFAELLKKKGKVSDEDENNYTISVKQIIDSNINHLFAIQLLNNDLSVALMKVKGVIDKKDIASNNDRNSLHSLLINSLLEIGINDLMSIHCEVLLSNQVRSVKDELSRPDWRFKNEPSQMFSLKQSLSNHPSIGISLAYQDIARMLVNPSTYTKTKPSVMDLFIMKSPHTYVNGNETTDNNKIKIFKDK